MENKDLNLKILCKALYKFLGYNTHYEMQLRNKSYIATFKTHDISDIDVFGYAFKGDLTMYLVGAECKSGETNALDELYKFLGIAKYYHLDKAYLLKTRIHQNAREIALLNNLVCFTEAEIRIVLNGYTKDIEKLIAIEQAKYFKQRKILTYYRERNEKLIDYIQFDFWNKEEWRNIHNLLHRLKHSSHSDIIPNVSAADKYILFYVVELLAYSILRCIQRAVILSYSDFERAFISCLYGGADSLNERRRIQDAVNIATGENHRFEADWQDDLVTMCSRFVHSSYAASLIPNLLQDIYEDCIYENGLKLDRKIIKKYPDATRKFAQDLIQFVQKQSQNYKEHFEEFMAI